MEIDQALECIEVDTAVLLVRRNEGDNRALEVADIHILLLRFCNLNAFVPLGGNGGALIGRTASRGIGARFGQQLTAAWQHVKCGKVVARALGATDEVGGAIGAQQYFGRA